MIVLEWTYLIIIQSIILSVYYIKRNKVEDFELKLLFQSKIHFLIMNSAIILTCCYLNIKRQLFCIPVPWTLAILLLFCFCFLLFPFVNKKLKIFSLVAAFSGLGFFISLYIIFFGRQEYLIFIAVNLVVIFLLSIIIWSPTTEQNKFLNALWFYAAFVLAPYFILLQLILMFKSLQTKSQKAIYISSSIVVLSIGLLLTFQMKRIFSQIASSENIETRLRVLNKNPINNYLTELVLGAHWKYHTELCNYDGWRPPFHDPVLVISNKILFPYKHFAKDTKLYHNVQLYKKLYPNNPTMFECHCAINNKLFENN